jgi:hypothetical protein
MDEESAFFGKIHAPAPTFPAVNHEAAAGDPGAAVGRMRAGKQISGTHMSLALLPQLELPAVASRYTFPTMEGVFARLTREHGGNINVAKEGLVTITGNSVDAGRDADLPEVVNPDWNRCWTSLNVPDSWIQFDFGSRQVAVSSYLIRTYPCVKGFSHLRSWVLEGRGLSGRWIELDSRKDNQELDGKARVASFNCALSTFCNKIRLRQIGPNHHDDHYLVLTNIEFFGDIVGG